LNELAGKRLGQTGEVKGPSPPWNDGEAAATSARDKITVMPINIDENTFCRQSGGPLATADAAARSTRRCHSLSFHSWPFSQPFPPLPTRNVEEPEFHVGSPMDDPLQWQYRDLLQQLEQAAQK